MTARVALSSMTPNTSVEHTTAGHVCALCRGVCAVVCRPRQTLGVISALEGIHMNRLSCSVLRILALLCMILSLPSYAEPYNSPSNRFSVVFSVPWARTNLPDPSAELFVLCEPSTCGPAVLLAFGAFFDPNLKGGKLADFLRHANSTTITQEVKQSPMVDKVVVLKEGRTRLGSAEAYEVLSEITLKSGGKRMRHTFMTFNAGYVYSVSLGCPPEAHAKALAAAQLVLNSFRTN